jgi:hypothetical protein
LTCTFANDAGRVAVIRRLDLEGQGPREQHYQLRWHLFYESIEREHTKVDADARIELPPGARSELGVQFQGPLFGGGELWPIGDYAFQLLGWAHDRTSQDKANLVTEFHATLSPADAAWLRQWQRAPASVWDDPGITNRAVGIPLPMHDIKPGR